MTTVRYTCTCARYTCISQADRTWHCSLVYSSLFMVSSESSSYSSDQSVSTSHFWRNPPSPQGYEGRGQYCVLLLTRTSWGSYTIFIYAFTMSWLGIKPMTCYTQSRPSASELWRPCSVVDLWVLKFHHSFFTISCGPISTALKMWIDWRTQILCLFVPAAQSCRHLIQNIPLFSGKDFYSSQEINWHLIHKNKIGDYEI